MEMMSRRGFLSLASVAALGTGSGCAGIGSKVWVKSGSGPIAFWSNHPGLSTVVEKELIRRFECQFPGLSVKLVDAGKGYDEVAQKFNSALIGSDIPDVVVLDDMWWFHFALNGVLAPLDEMFTHVGLNPADYSDPLLADYKFNGRHYALPYSRSTPLFYYNKTRWEQAGLPDRGPHTWQEFDDWGPRLQRVVGADRWAHGWSNGERIGWTFEALNWAFGGSYSDKWVLKFTDSATILAGNYFRDSIHRKRYASIANDTASDFATGIHASTVASTGALIGITAMAKFDVGVAPLPTGPGGVPACPTGGAGLAIPAQLSEERRINALRFIEFVTNAANTAYFSQRTGYLVVRKSAVEEPSEQKFLAANPNAKVAISQLPCTRPQDYARVFLPGGDRIISAGLETIGLQGADVTTTFAAIERKLQVIIDRQIKRKLPS